jgi:hypothetical protein
MHVLVILAKPRVTVLLTDVDKPSVFDWMKLILPLNVDGKIFCLKQCNPTMSKDPMHEE